MRIRLAGPDDATELARLKEAWADLSEPATGTELAEFAVALRRWMHERGDEVSANARAASMYLSLGFEPTPLLLERRGHSAPSQ